MKIQDPQCTSRGELFEDYLRDFVWKWETHPSLEAWISYFQTCLIYRDVPLLRRNQKFRRVLLEKIRECVNYNSSSKLNRVWDLRQVALEVENVLQLESE